MKSIRYCLNKQLAEICQRSVQLEEMTQRITNLLPTDLSPYCKVSSFNKGCLVLTAANAAWASQLRFAAPELRDQLRKAGLYQLTSIKINIAEGPEYQKIKKSIRYELNYQVKKNILNESQNCTYEPLRQALLNFIQKEEK